MIRHPYGPDELDRNDPALDGVAGRLQEFAAAERSAPPLDLAARIHAAVDAAPDPAVGWWARFAGPIAGWSLPLRGAAAAAVVTAAIVTALVVGNLSDLVQGPAQPGTTPSPSEIVSPVPSPSLSPSPTPTPTPTPPASPTEDPATPVPSPTDDHGGFETPEPSSSDNSGPGGGGNSGPGGGGNSGPGGGSGSDD